ncbi:MAG TPA: thioredoxin [Saprospiraceae bacterium]|nr:thioredoxin [Saprospiraceae bacterium]
MARPVNKKTFLPLVLKSDKPVIVDVWADWCGPCHVLAPNFAAAEDILEGKVRFLKLDAEKNQKLVKKYQVRSLPTLLIFNEGEVVERSVGVITKGAIVNKLKPYLKEAELADLPARKWWQFWA